MRPASLVTVVIAIVLTATPAHDQVPAARLSLDDTVELALRSNPTIRAKQRALDATRANEITAGLIPNPVASYSAEQLGSPNVDKQHTVALGQTIELGGKRGRRLDSARAASRVTELELADVRRQVVAQVKKAFIDVLVAQATAALAAENLTTLDEIERVNRLRAEKGDIADLELLRIQVQRFAFEKDLLDARQALGAAKITLRALTSPDALAEAFDVTGDLAFRDVALDRERLLARLPERRPDVLAAEAVRARARPDVSLARANAWWDVTPQVQYQRIGTDNTFGVGVSIPLRVFDRNQGEIARTRAEVDRADRLREAAVVQARAELETAFAAVRSEREKVRMLREIYLPRAQRVRETVDYAYRRGGLSVLDLLDAQRTYRETALEHVRALGTYWATLYQLEAAAGGSLEP